MAANVGELALHKTLYALRDDPLFVKDFRGATYPNGPDGKAKWPVWSTAERVVLQVADTEAKLGTMSDGKVAKGL